MDSHKVPASQGSQVATSSCIWYTCVKDFDQDWDTSATRETPNAVKVSTSTWTPPVYQVQTKMGEITQSKHDSGSVVKSSSEISIASSSGLELDSNLEPIKSKVSDSDQSKHDSGNVVESGSSSCGVLHSNQESIQSDDSDSEQKSTQSEESDSEYLDQSKHASGSVVKSGNEISIAS